jgi:hypothetical protein
MVETAATTRAGLEKRQTSLILRLGVAEPVRRDDVVVVECLERTSDRRDDALQH